MENNQYFKIKIIILTIYFIFEIVGLPLIFFFPPRDFLFAKDSEEDEDKKYLFKHFVSEIHDNINKQLITNFIFTKDNEECPEDFTTLAIEHQYYGNFTRFYRNSSFCIKRTNDENLKFKRLLEKSLPDCGSQKSCGLVNKISKTLLCVDKSENCPLNNFDYQYKESEYSSQISGLGIYFTPEYGNNPDNALVIDIDLIYKYRSCLEKFHRLEKTECEFKDNDDCRIEDDVTSIQKRPGDISNKDLLLSPPNLAKINIKNDDNLDHDYCEGAKKNKIFHTYIKGFVNFKKEDLDNFLEEFPDKVTNDPLSDICETYKSDKNFDILFHYFAFIILILSIFHFVLQLLLFVLKTEHILKLIHKIFLWNGIIQFLAKLIFFIILIIIYYSFYLKFKAVYLDIEYDPRKKIINSYKNLRDTFIIKIIAIWLAGFIIICVELIIFCFVMTFSQIIFLKITDDIILDIQLIQQITKPNNKPNENSNIEQEKKDISNGKEEDKKTNISSDNQKNKKFIIPFPDSMPIHNSLKCENPYNTIEIVFQIKDNEINDIKEYRIRVKNDDTFFDVEAKLKKQFPELEGKKMGTFRNGSHIISRSITVKENKIQNKDIIIVDC